MTARLAAAGDGASKAAVSELARSYAEEEIARKARIDRIVDEGSWPRELWTETGWATLIDLVDGRPVYRRSLNADAADTIGADETWAGGSLGLTVPLDGAGSILGLWDQAKPLATHQELVGRIEGRDPGTATADHPTHMAGSMIGAGIDPGAHGMANTAMVAGWTFVGDLAEMAMEQQAADPIALSCHPYSNLAGWSYFNHACDGSTFNHWLGDVAISAVEDPAFGLYGSEARSWDELVWAAPSYLPVTAAGNDRGNPSFLTQHCHYENGSFVAAMDSHPPDGGVDGWDSLAAGHQTAKNILTVGGALDVIGGWSDPADVVLIPAPAGSGIGPADDGRIKPDLVAPGDSVYSSIGTGDAAYDSWTGTSSANAVATGGLALVRQQIASSIPDLLTAAGLKAVVLHTASEAGTSPGPDYRFGWGLLDVAGAVQWVRDAELAPPSVVRWRVGSIAEAELLEWPIWVDGGQPLRATLVWTDPPGTAQAGDVLDPPDPALVHDLDLVLVSPGGTEHFPWLLDRLNPSAPPTRGDNQVDNVERVDVALAEAGLWTLRMNVDGGLAVGTGQPFAVLVSGSSEGFDFGDAPTSSQSGLSSSYPTLDADAGARHGDGGVTLRLGSSWDPEVDGQPTALADGDGSDEDGIVVGMEWVQGVDALAEVTVMGGGGLLDAWVDWNVDGDWDDPGEQVLSSEPVSAGSQGVAISVPVWATGETTARFRLSTTGGLKPTGGALDGEVEDLRTPPILPPADATVTAEGPEVVVAGGSASWTLTASNAIGTATLRSSFFQLAVPVGTVVDMDSSDPGWSCVPNAGPGSLCEFPLGDLGAGAETSASLGLVFDEIMSAGLEALTLSPELDGLNGESVSIEIVVSVLAAPDLSVTKIADRDVVAPGTSLAWTLEWANRRPGASQDASGVVLREVVPMGATFDAAASEVGWSCSGGEAGGVPCELSLGTVAAGAAGTVRFGVRVDDGTSGDLSNTVEIVDDGASGEDAAPGDETATSSVLVDGIAPRVVGVRVAGDGVADCQTVRSEFGSVVVEFDESVVGADDPASWRLLAAGPDQTWQTTGCDDAPAGDDVLLPVSPSNEGETAAIWRLNVLKLRAMSSGVAPGLVRLYACGAGLEDLAGNALDGQGTGVLGTDFVRSFRADPGNRWRTGNFDDCPVDLSDWDFEVGVGGVVEAGFPGQDDFAGSSESASARILAPPEGLTRASQCLEVHPGEVLDRRIGLRVGLGTVVSRRFCEFHTAPSCEGAAVDTFDARSSVSPSEAFALLEDEVEVPSSASSARCGLELRGWLGNSEVWVDALYLGNEGLIFADGFETGSVDSWSLP